MKENRPFPILELKSGRERSVKHFHPWLFSGAVKQFPVAKEGEVAEVRTNQGEILAYGFISPSSQILCRLFHFGEAQDFETVDYWATKLEKAFAYRKELLNRVEGETNCYRLIHAEGDFFPGIIADVYGETVVLQVLIKGTELRLPLITAAITQVTGLKRFYLKTKDSSGRIEKITLKAGWLNEAEALPMPLQVLENGLKFHVDIEKGQKTGFFLDQRDNRQLVRTLSSGKKVLNAFSYTGGFSLYAGAGGAREVHSVDISKEAVAQGEENFRLNFGTEIPHQSLAQDCFQYLRSCDEDFDLMILDPPAFAKNAKAVDNACRGYKDLNLSAMRKIKSGGDLLTYSCSQNITPDLFRKVVFAAAADSGREVRIVKTLTQASCHPINIYHPEGEYLKGLWLKVY